MIHHLTLDFGKMATRYVFKRVGNPLIGIFVLAILFLGCWIYYKMNPAPNEFFYVLNESETEMTIHFNKGIESCQTQSLTSKGILHSSFKCKNNNHPSNYYHWEDMPAYNGNKHFCHSCMTPELIQAYNDSLASYTRDFN